MTVHPDLLRAVVLAAIVSTPDHYKRQLVSKVQKRREKAEEALTARLVIALLQRS